MDILVILQMLHQVAQLRKHEHWTRSQLEAYQIEALHHLRQYAYARSPFYRQFHKGLTDRPLQELPVLTKAMLMEHFDDLVTDQAIHLEGLRAYAAQDEEGRRFLNRYWVNATSGSSGHPGFFLFNRAEWLTVLASFARSQEWAGLGISLTHRTKMAYVASVTPWHMSAQVAATVKSWWMPTLRLPASQLLEEIVQALNAWQPEILVAYASMVRILAEEQLAGRLHITPRRVWSSSEVLTDETRRRSEAAWKQLPFNQYAATEIGGLAGECGNCRSMHLYEDLVIVEVVDENNHAVPPGAYGSKVLMTSLFGRTQPLIRYELDDSLRLATEPCPCRQPFARLDGIQGRVENVIFLPAKAGGSVAIQPLVFNRIMDVIPASGWQVIQEAGQLNVLLSGVHDESVDDLLVGQLAQALSEQGADVPTIHIQRVSVIPKSASGKAPLIRSNLPMSALLPTGQTTSETLG